MLVLDAALLTMLCVLMLGGWTGWSCLGASPPSVVTANLPSDNFLSSLARFSLATYILCTYPLQLFPAAEAMDPWFAKVTERLLGRPIATVTVSGSSARRQEGEGGRDEEEENPTVAMTQSSTASSRESNVDRDVVAGTVVPSARISNRLGDVLRIGLLLSTGLVASLVSSFAAVISFIGWLSFGILSFLVPPLVYFVQVQTLFSLEQRRAGLHREDWKRQMGDGATVATGGSGGAASTKSSEIHNNHHHNRSSSFRFTFWEVECAGLLIYSVAGLAVTAIGLIGVVREVLHDQSGTDSVGGGGGGGGPHPTPG